MREPEKKPPLLTFASAAGLIAGIAIFVATLVLPPPTGLAASGWHTLGLALLMAVWWSTEPVPIGVTALLPLIAFPLLGIADIADAAAPYANPLVFLFLGGFLLAAGIKRWGLHRRIAFGVVARIGNDPARLVLGFMVASGFLSMWISNTATVILLLPVAISVIVAIESEFGENADTDRFARAVLLGLAYAASIGGVGTLIGTPPNALLAGYLGERHGIQISFAAWSVMAMPLVVVFLPLAWLLLTRVIFPLGRHLHSSLHTNDIVHGIAGLGPMTPPERRTGIVFLVVALLWLARPLLNRLPMLEGLSDPGIALAGAAALFLIPSGSPGERRFLMSWREAQDISWQVLILFGGGLSIAAAMDTSGLAQWLGHALAGFGHLSPFVFLLVVTTVVVLLTELASNTATTAALLPVVATLAAGADMDVVTLSAAVAIAASCAFMLPVATPPNAIVFSGGHVRIADMVRAGALMNVLSILLVSSAIWLLGQLLARLH